MCKSCIFSVGYFGARYILGSKISGFIMYFFGFAI